MKNFFQIFIIYLFCNIMTTSLAASPIPPTEVDFVECYTIEFCMFSFKENPPQDFDANSIVLVRDLDISFRLRFGCNEEKLDEVGKYAVEILEKAKQISLQGLKKNDNRISAFLVIDGRPMRDWIVMKQFSCT